MGTVQSILSEYHGTRVCTPQIVASIVLILVLILLAAWALSTHSDELVTAARFIEDLGFGGHLVFFALYIWVGVPFGHNWTTLTLLVGFAYGWVGLIDVEVGTMISSVINVYLARKHCASSVDRLILRLGRKKRLYVQAIQKVVESGKGAGVLMLLLVRINPILTFGIQNASIGCFCRTGILTNFATTFVGYQIEIIKTVHIANFIRHAGSLEAASQGEVGQTSLLVSVGILILIIVASVVLGRYLAVHVLPHMIGDDLRQSQLGEAHHATTSADTTAGSVSPRQSASVREPSAIGISDSQA